jgi:hypothetical protein
MEKTICPVGKYKDEEFELHTIFDTLSIRNDIANAVSCIFVFMVKNKNSKSVEIIKNIIEANIGKDNYKMLQEMYLDTYNFETKKVKRYFYIEDTNDIYKIMDSFTMIYRLIPVLQRVASYYTKKGM